MVRKEYERIAKRNCIKMRLKALAMNYGVDFDYRAYGSLDGSISSHYFYKKQFLGELRPHENFVRVDGLFTSKPIVVILKRGFDQLGEEAEGILNEISKEGSHQQCQT